MRSLTRLASLALLAALLPNAGAQQINVDLNGFRGHDSGADLTILGFPNPGKTVDIGA